MDVGKMKNDLKGTLRKHEEQQEEEENKLLISSSSTNNKRRRRKINNDVWNTIQCALAKKKRQQYYDMSEEEEEMSKKSCKRKRRNDETNVLLVLNNNNKRRRRKMLTYIKRNRNISSSSSSISVVRTTSSSGFEYLSEDLIFELLSTTTCVTSLLRCKSVCKLWHSIISKPQFMNAHHLNSLNKLPSVMMITSRVEDDEGRRGATIVYPNSPHSVSVPLIPPFDELDFIRSFNGVVCVFDNASGDIYLLNPLTRMSKKLPTPPAAPFSNTIPPTLTSKVDIGFGFDSVSRDFKVLWIEYQAIHNYYYRDVVAVKLYSTLSDSWTNIKVGIELPSLPYRNYCPVMRSGPVVNGVLYLEAVNAIITFHLHDELFGLISYPSFIHTRKSNILDFEGSMAVVLETVTEGSLDEKELGLWTPIVVSDEVVWNKMFNFGPGSEEIDWMFLYSGANQFFGRTRLGEMFYDYKKKQTRYVGLPSQSFLVRVLNHTESFLSVEGFEGGQRQMNAYTI